MFLALAVLACVIPAQASAASNPSVPDVPASFWAHAQIMWSVNAGWVPLHKNGTFAPGRDATRTAAARVLASLNQQQHGVAVSDDPFQQAVDGGWIGAGLGPGSTLTQLQFDRGIVRVMGLKKDSIRLRQITAADGWKPKLPTGFAVEQIVRDIGARWNVPFGADNWETWPSSTLRRANLAVQAYLLGHLPSYWQSVRGHAAERGARAAEVPAAEEGRARLRAEVGGRALHLGRQLRPAAGSVRASRRRRLRLLGLRVVGDEALLHGAGEDLGRHREDPVAHHVRHGRAPPGREAHHLQAA